MSLMAFTCHLMPSKRRKAAGLARGHRIETVSQRGSGNGRQPICSCAMREENQAHGRNFSLISSKAEVCADHRLRGVGECVGGCVEPGDIGSLVKIAAILKAKTNVR